MRAAILLVLILTPGILTGCVRVKEDSSHYVANVLLPEPYSRLEISIHYAEGRRPHPAAVEAFAETVKAVVLKDEVVIHPPQVLHRPKGTINDGKELNRIRDAIARDVDSKTVELFVLYLDGKAEGRSDILGEAGVDVIILYIDEISKFPQHRFGPDQIERFVLVHEFGHVIGLVNLSLPMQVAREDPNSRGHSQNPESVMFGGFLGRARTDHLLDDVWFLPHTFDEYDLQDIRAFQKAHLAKTTRR